MMAPKGAKIDIAIFIFIISIFSLYNATLVFSKRIMLTGYNSSVCRQNWVKLLKILKSSFSVRYENGVSLKKIFESFVIVESPVLLTKFYSYECRYKGKYWNLTLATVLVSTESFRHNYNYNAYQAKDFILFGIDWNLSHSPSV